MEPVGEKPKCVGKGKQEKAGLSGSGVSGCYLMGTMENFVKVFETIFR
jgi:hypothetical protein